MLMKYLLFIIVFSIMSCGPQKAEIPSWRGFKKDTLPEGWRMSDEGVLTHTKGGGMSSQRKSTRTLFLNLIGKFRRVGTAASFFMSAKTTIMFGLADQKCKF